MAGPKTVNIGTESNGRRAHVTPATAASYKRMRAQGLPAGGLTSTTRDWNTQARWHKEWKLGKRRAYAAPPALSSHCKGTAVDFGSAHKNWMARHGAANGWRRTNKDENWHYVYFANLDKRKNVVARVPAKAAAAVKFIPLRAGIRGKRVAALQRQLNAKFPGYIRLKVDGDYGPATRRAIGEFQRRAGLKVDGKVGPVTASALRHHGIKI